jgi:hypothetical protein
MTTRVTKTLRAFIDLYFFRYHKGSGAMVQHFKFLIQDALSNISNQDVKSFISAQETEEDSEDDPCTWSLSK